MKTVERAVGFETADKVQLNGQLFEHPNPNGVTILHGATGVPTGYYMAFAAWYGEQKRHHVLIYAYRDTENMTPEAVKTPPAKAGGFELRL